MGSLGEGIRQQDFFHPYHIAIISLCWIIPWLLPLSQCYLLFYLLFPCTLWKENCPVQISVWTDKWWKETSLWSKKSEMYITLSSFMNLLKMVNDLHVCELFHTTWFPQWAVVLHKKPHTMRLKLVLYIFKSRSVLQRIVTLFKNLYFLLVFEIIRMVKTVLKIDYCIHLG